MQQSNEKQKVKLPMPGEKGNEQPGQQQPDKKVTGQQDKGNKGSAPVQPMKKNAQEDRTESMGSGKRQDDN
jgi:hypothetical protein